MKKNMKLGAVLLAAGKSERFGANKLLAPFCGKPMICHALEAMGGLDADQSVVVTGDAACAELARQHGYEVIINDRQELGMSHSVNMGISALAGMDAAVLLAADQPLLSAESLVRLVQEYKCSSKGIACLRDETHMGNPAVFAAQYFTELCLLTGDRGAKGILRRHECDLLVVSCAYYRELSDADTPQTLRELELLKSESRM